MVMKVQMSGGGKDQAAIALALWLFFVIFFMVLSQQLNLEIFFVLWLIGLLVVTELTETVYVTPTHLRYRRGIIAAGVIIFGIIVARKVLEILAS